MKDNLNIKIRGLGPINESSINIGKINVVGGHNGTGKSTTSKLLYAFLRANCTNRNDFAYNQATEGIRSFIRTIYSRYGIERPEYVDPEFSKIKIYSDSKPLYFDDLSLIEKYEQAKKDYYDHGAEHPLNKFIEEDIKEIDDVIYMINDNDDDLFVSIFKNVLLAEFNGKLYNFNVKFSGTKNGSNFNVDVNLKDGLWDSNNFFKSNGSFNIEDVFYIDSFSFFETSTTWVGPTHHVGYLKQVLNPYQNKPPKLFDEKFNKSIVDIEYKIKEIIGGEIGFNKGYQFTSPNLDPIDMQNTASGIKQIGVVQLLLAKRKLKKDSFLIIDEPEVNLHPEWQIKFAKILVLLAKDLNITIYINTHSPMFMEAMSLYSEYYDLLDDTCMYLTEKQGDGFRFKQIDPKDMGAIYENLSRPYDDLDDIKSKIIFKG